jgi:hypothetical protein
VRSVRPFLGTDVPTIAGIVLGHFPVRVQRDQLPRIAGKEHVNRLAMRRQPRGQSPVGVSQQMNMTGSQHGQMPPVRREHQTGDPLVAETVQHAGRFVCGSTVFVAACGAAPHANRAIHAADRDGVAGR